MKTVIIASPDDMVKLGSQIVKNYSKILIYWDLGVWKTHLVKGFASWLGIEKDKVTSPTYTIINNYDNKLLHIDMYRLKEFSELIDKWILDSIDRFDYICIERPKREEEYIDDQWLKIKIEKINDNKRKVSIYS